MVVASDILVIALSSNVLLIVELAHSETVYKIPIPRKASDMTIYQLFLDPSGRHIIITSLQGENWYLFRTSKKPRQLKSLRMVIESIAWNTAALLSATNPTSTREMLIGSRDGVIYEAVLSAEEDFFKSQERYMQKVFTLPERQPVTGLKYNFFPPSDPRKVLVVVSTPSRIYQFVGAPDRRAEEGGRFGTVLASSSPSEYCARVLCTSDSLSRAEVVDLPGNISYSELHYFTPNAVQSNSMPKTIAWMTGLGIFHGNLNFQSTSDDFIDAADVLPYPPSITDGVETPLSIALTEFHYMVLYRDRIVGICQLDDKIAWDEPLPLVRPSFTLVSCNLNIHLSETRRRDQRYHG